MPDLTYSVATTATADKTFTTGGSPYSSEFWRNPSDATKSILFVPCSGSSRVDAFVFNPDSIGTGAFGTATKNFTTGSTPTWATFWYNTATPSQSILFSADSGATRLSAFLIDPNSLGTGSFGAATKTFTTSSGPQAVVFWQNPVDITKSLLISCDRSGSRVSIFLLDPTNLGTGSFGAATKTFTTSTNPYSLWFWYNSTTPAQSIIFVACSGSARVEAFLVDAQNLGTGSGGTATKTFTTGAIPQSVVFFEHPSDATKSILFTADTGVPRLSAYVLDPYNLGTGTVASPTKTFTLLSTSNVQAVAFYQHPTDLTKCILFAAEAGLNRLSAWTVDANSFGTGSVSTPNRTFGTLNTPINASFWYNGTTPIKSLLLSADRNSTNISAFQPFDIENAITVTAVSSIPSSLTITSGAVVVSSSVSFFQLASFLALRSDILLASNLERSNYTQSGDADITLSQSLTFSGSTAQITGSYTLYMGASRTLRLGTSSTYNMPITVPSTGVIEVVQSISIGSLFNLASGTTINRASGVTDPVTVTVTTNPGLVAGTGVTIVSPRPTLTFTGIPSGTEARITQGSITLAYESNITDGDFSYEYASGGEPVAVSFNKPGYIQQRINLTLSSISQTIPLVFEPDPSYVA